MRKNKQFIKLLLLPIVLGLSSCAAAKSPDYSSWRNGSSDRSYSFVESSNSSGETTTYARGKRIFDSLYDKEGYQSVNYVNTFPTLNFIKNDKGYFTVTVAGEYIERIDTLYSADINFDGHEDLCIGRVMGEEDHLAVFAYDVHNNNKLLELNETPDESLSKDYALNIRNNYLVIESSYNCSLTALDRFGYFKRNTENAVSLEWKTIQFELLGLEQDVSGTYNYKGSDGVSRYIVNTTDTYDDVYVFINFEGDVTTNPYGSDCVTLTESDGYNINISHKGVNYLRFSIHFNKEGIYDIRIRVADHYVTLRFEANNNLYDMLEVA